MLFNHHHLNLLSKVQQLFITLECNTLVAFIRLLFTNKNAEDIIKRGHSEIDTRQSNVT